MDDAHSPAVTDEILEDCLQALHRIESQGGSAVIGDVVAFARISPAVAQVACRELRIQGLLGPQPDRLVLSEEGRKHAAAILRRHRLSERLLTDVLGLPWDRVHDEAMRLEHSLTSEAETRLQSLLNDPETCPHGGPIPGADSRLDSPRTRRLDTVPVGEQVRIEQITEQAGTFLRYLASLGLLPQTEIAVEEVAPFGGPLLVRVGGARYAIGRDVAAKILVCNDREPPGPRRLRRRRRGPLA